MKKLFRAELTTISSLQLLSRTLMVICLCELPARSQVLHIPVKRVAAATSLQINWTQWTIPSVKPATEVQGRINAKSLDIIYRGEVFDVMVKYPSWTPVSTFSGGIVGNSPPSSGGIVGLRGGDSSIHSISFSRPIVDPVIAVWSLGAKGFSASFDFQTTQAISIESGGLSAEYGGEGLAQVQNSVQGSEGNGTIQLHGTFTDISWITPVEEQWSGFTVGVPNIPPNQIDTTPISSVATDGLVAYYPFDNNTSDITGHTPAGLVSNVSFAPGMFGSAINVTGTLDSYVTVVPTDSLGPKKAVSISLWFNQKSIQNGYACLLYKPGSEPTSGGFTDRSYTLWVMPGGGIHFASASDGASSQTALWTSGGLFGLDEWVHVVGIVDTVNHSIAVYVNGQLAGSTVYHGDNIISGAYPLRIGAPFLTLFDQLGFDGLIDDVQIYNKALSAAEIQQLYRGVTGGPAAPFILIEPRSATLPSGASATFTVAVTGTTPLIYQWQKNKVNIVGAVAPSFTINSVSTADIGLYSVLIRNSLGYVLSSSASLNIMPSSKLSGRTIDANTLEPIADVTIRLDGGPAIKSSADGSFILSDISPGLGYLLNVSAAGYESKRVRGVDVSSAGLALSTIPLNKLTTTLIVSTLVPNVNPPTSSIEDGGVAYRYYRIVTSSGNGVGGQRLVLRHKSSGAFVEQQNDVSESWAGQSAGVSDSDGIVRLRLSSSDVGSPKTTESFDVLSNSQIVDTFDATVLDRNYDQIWKLKYQGGVVGKVKPIEAGIVFGGAASAESEIRIDRSQNQTITRTREGELQVGFEAGPAAEILGAGEALFASADAFIAADLSPQYIFSGASENPTDAGLKLLLSIGDLALSSPIAAEVYPAFESFEDVLSASKLSAASGSVRIGGTLKGDAEFGLGNRKASLRFGVSGSAQTDIAFTLGSTYRQNKISDFVGVNVDGTIDAFLGASLGKTFLGPFGSAEGSWEILGKTSLPLDNEVPQRLEVEQAVSGSWELDFGLSTLRSYSLSAAPLPGQAYAASYKETIGYNLTPSGGWLQLGTIPAAFWMILKKDTSPILVGTPLFNAVDDLARYASSHAGLMDYMDTLYLAEKRTLGGELLNVDVGLGLAITLQGAYEKGVETVLERGAVWQNRKMPLESYPTIRNDKIPSASLLDLVGEWASEATESLRARLDVVVQQVKTGAETIIVNGKAIVKMSAGAIQSGANIALIRAEQIFGLKHSRLSAQSLTGAQSADADLIYGVGGVYHLAGSNTFTGSASLSISYADSDLINFTAGDLQIYYLPDTTNRWTLVGGTLDLNAKTISATISNFGSYALAPPLPTGKLDVQISYTNSILDGTFLISATVSNIILNTGISPVKSWPFTIRAIGVDVISPDVNTNLDGVQVYSTNNTLSIQLRASKATFLGSVSIQSVYGDASGSSSLFNFSQTNLPSPPQSIYLSAEESKITASWEASSDSGVSFYKVYYRPGLEGPPFDGKASVEGLASPISVAGTNTVLRGLTPNTNYFIAVSAVDFAGNEGPGSKIVSVATREVPPSPVSFPVIRKQSGVGNLLMWALSEDDGYNNRDVVKYEVWRAVLPTGAFIKIAEVPAGQSCFIDSSPPSQSVTYAVSVVAFSGLTSQKLIASPESIISSVSGHVKPASQGRNEPATQIDVTRSFLSRISLHHPAKELLERKMLVQLRKERWLVHFDL